MILYTDLFSKSASLLVYKMSIPIAHNILPGSRLNISIQWISVLVNNWEPIINTLIVMYFFKFKAVAVDTLFNYVGKYIEISVKLSLKLYS